MPIDNKYCGCSVDILTANFNNVNTSAQNFHALPALDSDVDREKVMGIS